MNTKHSKWYYPSEKMPKIGERILVSDGDTTIEIIVESLPDEPYKGNVVMWRYVNNENINCN